MSVQPETAEAIATTLIRVTKIMASMRHHAPRLHPAVDPSHYPVLFTLASEPRRVSALADMIHSDVSTVSRQVSHLVQHGIIEKIGDPEDGRAQLLSLSAAGTEVLEKLARGRETWFRQLLADWSDEDARAFEQYLTRFGNDVEAFKAGLSAATAAPSHQEQ
jgi:DNA-binding MarR family transcriptional regulator